ncbi:MAG: hypothetical protein O7I42_00530, partial [Alphaproteobacteria bacterium]|nr:hypothetical protein [Alphaproteobacteria bacterium]
KRSFARFNGARMRQGLFERGARSYFGHKPSRASGRRKRNAIKASVKLICLLLAVLALVLTGAGTALAQSGPPVKLSPQAQPRGASPEGGTTPRGGMRIQNLDRLNPDSVGVLDDDKGGLGASLWNGSSRATVASLLAQLPLQYRSPTLRDLAIRLLLTRAVAPRGLVVGESLVAKRLDRLYRMGEVEHAASLIKVTPSTLTGARLSVIEANVAFLKGDAKEACRAVRRHLAARITIDTRRALIVCQALEKDGDRAALGLNLLREEGAIPDESWEQLVEAVAYDRRIRLRSLAKAGPTHLVLADAAKLRLPRDVIKTEDVAVLKTLALSGNTPIAERLAAGETLARTGILAPKALAGIYAALPIGKGELNIAIARAKRRYDARARARLYQAARAERDAGRRAAILTAAWRLARKKWDYSLAARVLAPIVADMVPDAKLSGFAAAATRALLYAGEWQLAAGWYKLLESGQGSEPATRLWPIVRLAAPDRMVWDTARLHNWALIQRRDKPSDAVRRIAILYTLFRAVEDERSRAEDWTQLLPKAAIARTRGAVPRLWRSMRAAAFTSRKGETVLSALAGIEKGALSALDSVDLDFVLTSLRQVGLTREVRALAVEAALANGF